jgi:Major Facilitator Superfamily
LTPAGAADFRPAGEGYKWTALANTTAAVFISALDGSIVLIAMPAIFRGIHLDPLAPENIVYLLWMITGYRLVQAVLVVSVGRMGDMYGRVRIYNAGFVIFTAALILLSFEPLRRQEWRSVADRLAASAGSRRLDPGCQLGGDPQVRASTGAAHDTKRSRGGTSCRTYDVSTMSASPSRTWTRRPRSSLAWASRSRAEC